MSKSASAFRTISQVADWLGVQTHVLRFWESKFSQVKPVKRAGGRRYYRPADMMLLGGIKKLLHDDGLTIKGVQKILREQGIPHVSAFSQPLDTGLDANLDSDSAPDVIDAQPNDIAVETPTPDEPIELAPETVDAALIEDANEDANPPADLQPGDQISLNFDQDPPDPSQSTDLVGDPQPALADMAADTESADPQPAALRPGALGLAARLQSLDATLTPEIAQLAQELRAWLDDARTASPE
jgi:DNA-binding transcriptional MerR regulator